MKNMKFLLSLLVITILISTVAFANGDLIVRMDGEKVKVREVPVVLDGNPVYSDIPTFIKDGSTLVPLRFIAETYGAKVDYQPKGRKILINQDGKEIEMAINSSKVKINGEGKKITGNTPRLVLAPGQRSSSTMVPLRFISETLGYEADYDKDAKVPYINTKKAEEKPVEEPKEPEKPVEEPVEVRGIKNIELVKGSGDLYKVKLTSTDKLDFTVNSKSKQIVYTFKNTGLALEDASKEKNISVNKKPIESISIKEEASNVKMTINLSENLDLGQRLMNDGKELIVHFAGKIADVRIDKYQGKDAIVIDHTRKSSVRTMTMTDPNRLVLDIMDMNLGKDFVEYKKDLGIIKNIRASQFTPDKSYSINDRVVRMVFDLKEKASDDNLQVIEENNRIIVIPTKSISNYIDYRTYGVEGDLTVKLDKSVNYDYSYNESSKTAFIEFPLGSIDMNEGYMVIYDGLVNEISLEEKSGKLVLAISFSRSLELRDLTQGQNTSNIKLHLKRTMTGKPSDMLIAIDPGHGGHDSGAVNKTLGIREKDVILPVSLKVDSKLKNKGYNTYLTREDDSFVELNERGKLANNVNADIFVSIHANSFKSSSANGIESFHSGTEQSKNLSKYILEEMVAETGAINRGHQLRPGLAVLRTSKMPATLVELGFITNPKEGPNLTDDSYQERLADAIVRGIEKYFLFY